MSYCFFLGGGGGFVSVWINTHAHTGTPQPGIRKLELTRENLSALLSGHGTLKQKSQPLSAFKRGTNQTSGGRGPGIKAAAHNQKPKVKGTLYKTMHSQKKAI